MLRDDLFVAFVDMSFSQSSGGFVLQPFAVKGKPEGITEISSPFNIVHAVVHVNFLFLYFEFDYCFKANNIPTYRSIEDDLLQMFKLLIDE